MAKREVDWLLLATVGREYFSVVSTHTTHPKGETANSFPTGPAAERFAANTVKMPGISYAKVLDPQGRMVVDFTESSKYTVETHQTDTGFALTYKE